ncbi:MAG: hypothetical protein Q7S87_09575 [Agitococcus sp.]|nr:hypothetical protein [Agitococcus sp.]
MENSLLTLLCLPANLLKKATRYVSQGYDELSELRDEFGLTHAQREDILSLARLSQRGRDLAEELACHGYDLRTSEYLLLLTNNNIAIR